MPILLLIYLKYYLPLTDGDINRNLPIRLRKILIAERCSFPFLELIYNTVAITANYCEIPYFYFILFLFFL
jgi:hypothetical protein